MTNEEKLKQICDFCEYISIIGENKISLLVSDTEKFIYNNSCDALNVKSKIGSLIPSGGAIRDALNENRVIIKEVPKEVYGFSFRAVAIPIKNDENDVIGVLVAGKSLSKEKHISAISQELSNTFSEITANISSISEGIQNLAAMNMELLSESKKSGEIAEETKEVIGFIQAISKQTNLLGLNAAIESARAGEAGRGFKIVAEEIRKLSNDSSESIKKIDSVIKDIVTSTSSINEKIVKSNDISQSQSAVIEEINAAMVEVDGKAKKLAAIAKEL